AFPGLDGAVYVGQPPPGPSETVQQRRRLGLLDPRFEGGLGRSPLTGPEGRPASALLAPFARSQHHAMMAPAGSPRPGPTAGVPELRLGHYTHLPSWVGFNVVRETFEP